MADESPTVRRWELASQLRALREGRNLSLEDVAGHLLCSPSKISRIETAVRAPSARDVRDLARLYGVSQTRQDELMDLVREARMPGWWKSYDVVDARAGTYIGLEDAATALRSFQNVMIHGLLQTPAYTRALVRRILPELSPEGIQQYVETRQARQEKRLRSGTPFNYWVVLDQAAVMRQVGDRDVMREQLEFLVTCIRDRVVTLQIVPFDAGAHGGMEGPFSIMEFEESALPDVVYVENNVGQVYLDRPADLRKFREILNFLLAAAASPDNSVTLLQDLIDKE